MATRHQILPDDLVPNAKRAEIAYSSQALAAMTDLGVSAPLSSSMPGVIGKSIGALLKERLIILMHSARPTALGLDPAAAQFAFVHGAQKVTDESQLSKS